MSVGQDDWIGLRISRMRNLAHLTQQELADRAGLSRPFVANIEAGLRTINTRSTLFALAQALEVPVEQLIAPPPHAVSPDEGAVHATIPRIRAALDGAWEIAPGATAKLDSDVVRLMRARMACDYPTLAALIPSVLARSQLLADQQQDPSALTRFSKVCMISSMAIRPLGHVDLATRLAERAQWAALAAENPYAGGAAQFARAQCSLAGGVQGLRSRSLQLATTGAERLAGDSSDEGLSWFGLLHLHAGLTAATLGRDDEALAHVAEARDAATRVQSDPWLMEFGAPNVGVWEVATLLETNDPGRAPEVARRIPVRQLRTRQRQSHLWMHTGIAYFLSEDYPKATKAFLAAHRVAPAEISGRPRVREVVGAMMRDVRRQAGSPALRDLAVRVNVDPLAVPKNMQVT